MSPALIAVVTIIASLLFLALLLVVIGAAVWVARKHTGRFPRRLAEKGEQGERCVRAMLARFEAQGDRVINGLIFRHADDGMTSEIDNILLSTRGAFVIETKNRAGVIEGSDERAVWVQALGGTVREFPSPVKQNLGHIHHLKRALGTRRFFENVVIFVQGNVQGIESGSVFSLAEAEEFLARPTKHPLTARERDRLYAQLLALGEGVTREEHLRNLNKRN